MPVDQKEHQQHHQVEKFPDQIVRPRIGIESGGKRKSQIESDEFSRGTDAGKHEPHGKPDQESRQDLLDCQHRKTHQLHVDLRVLRCKQRIQHERHEHTQGCLDLHGHTHMPENGCKRNDRCAPQKQEQEQDQLECVDFHDLAPESRNLTEYVQREADHDLHHPWQRQHRHNGHDDDLRNKRERDLLN